MKRYVISVYHGKAGSLGEVIDRKTGRVKGRTSTLRDKARWMELLDIQCNALNRAHEAGEPDVPAVFRRHAK